MVLPQYFRELRVFSNHFHTQSKGDSLPDSHKWSLIHKSGGVPSISTEPRLLSSGIRSSIGELTFEARTQVAA